MNATTINRSFGLKWNPFAKDVPDEALVPLPAVEHFLRRVEHLTDEGGFAMITGDPGVGKSVAMRILHHRLRKRRDVKVAHLDRPQSSIADFYRELGDGFAVSVGASNRWGGFKTLRERWRSTLETTLVRPILLADEAQEIAPSVLSEIRILSAENFDSRALLTVVFAGDSRFPGQLHTPELLPLESRMRLRLQLQPVSAETLIEVLKSICEAAGNSRLMTDGAMKALAEHSHGNFRALMNMANELLVEGHDRKVESLDEKLYFDFVQGRAPKTPRTSDVRKKSPPRA